MSKSESENDFSVSGEDNDGEKTDSRENSAGGPKKDLEKLTQKVEDKTLLGPEENVRVVVRVRPMNKTETQKQCNDIIAVRKDSNAIELIHPVDNSIKAYRYDAVFAPDTSQADVYNLVARPIVQNVIEGYNGTIFAYGQTGTGKTFTMEGNNNVPELKGIIPNSFAQIFSHISHASGERRFLVRVSYLEIYNEDVRDLLSKDSSKKLEVKERSDSGVYVKDLSSFVVRNADEMDRIMATGNKNRSVGSTNMNIASSRSHAIFTISVEASIENDDGSLRSIRMGKLNLVDLAGSERISKTGATGQRLKEGAKINLSLSCLGNVISALVEGQSHIPYRTSKLTRLLQDSLGGNSKTVMCANIGPADYNYDETLSTLRYADRAKHIRNHARINEDPKDALLRQFQNEIEELRRQLQAETAAASAGGGEERRKLERSGLDDLSDEEGSDGGIPESEITSAEGVGPTPEVFKGIRGELQTHEELATSIEVDDQERHSALQVLRENVETWKEHEEKKQRLQEKLRSIKRKIMVGGENLLDKSEQQEEFLQRSMHELDQRKKEELKLRNTLNSKQVEREKSEERILQLQAESASLTKKLKKCWKQYTTEKNELDILTEDYRLEEDSICDEIKRSSKELKFMNHVIDQTIPTSFQVIIERCCGWNEDTGRWSLPGIAYTGNNIHRGVHNNEHHIQGRYPTQSRKLKDLSFLQLSLHEGTSEAGDNGDSGQRSARHRPERIFERRQHPSSYPDIIFADELQGPRKSKVEALQNTKSPPSYREN